MLTIDKFSRVFYVVKESAHPLIDVVENIIICFFSLQTEMFQLSRVGNISTELNIPQPPAAVNNQGEVGM